MSFRGPATAAAASGAGASTTTTTAAAAATDYYQDAPLVHSGTQLDFNPTAPQAKVLLRQEHVYYARAPGGQFIALLRLADGAYVKPTLEQQRTIFKAAKTPPVNRVALPSGVEIPILPPELYETRVKSSCKREAERAAGGRAAAQPAASAVNGAAGWAAPRSAGARALPSPQQEQRPARTAFAAAAPLPASPARPPAPIARTDSDAMDATAATAAMAAAGGRLRRVVSNESDLSEASDGDEERDPSLRIFAEMRAALRNESEAVAAPFYENPFAGVETREQLIELYGHNTCILLFRAFNTWFPV